MKILVTGGAGFLGSHIADNLTEDGHDVVIFDKEASPYLQLNTQVQVLGDICDAQALRVAVDGCDAIYHLAAIADVDYALRNPRPTIEVNVMGTLNVLEAARIQEVNRVVFASSIYVYSTSGAFYRTTKQACELMIQDYCDQFGVPFTILRFGSLYGPRADRNNAVHRMLKEAVEKQSITYGGTGDEAREYIHVQDAAAAAVHVLKTEYTGEILHLTGREKMLIKDLLSMINEIMGGSLAIRYGGKVSPGHYFQTPYSYLPKQGKKYSQEVHIDLGLGLLNCIEDIAKHR